MSLHSFVFACLLALPSAALARDFVVALKPDKNPEAMLTERKKLADALSKELGAPVRVIVPLSASVIHEGLANGSVDLAYLSSTDMVRARREKTAEVLFAGKIDGKTSYESYWVTLKDKPYDSIDDLKGKPVAFASKTSTSGYLVPLASLVRKNLLKEKTPAENFFGRRNVSFGTGYVSAIEKVFDGSAEAAAVSDYVITKDKHLTPEQKSRLKVLDRQGPVPTHVLAVRKGLEADRKQKLEKALMNFNRKERALRDQVFTSELVKVQEEEHLKPTLENFEMTGITL